MREQTLLIKLKEIIPTNEREPERSEGCMITYRIVRTLILIVLGAYGFVWCIWVCLQQ